MNTVGEKTSFSLVLIHLSEKLIFHVLPSGKRKSVIALKKYCRKNIKQTAIVNGIKIFVPPQYYTDIRAS